MTSKWYRIGTGLHVTDSLSNYQNNKPHVTQPVLNMTKLWPGGNPPPPNLHDQLVLGGEIKDLGWPNLTFWFPRKWKNVLTNKEGTVFFIKSKAHLPITPSLMLSYSNYDDCGRYLWIPPHITGHHKCNGYRSLRNSWLSGYAGASQPISLFTIVVAFTTASPGR